MKFVKQVLLTNVSTIKKGKIKRDERVKDCYKYDENIILFHHILYIIPLCLHFSPILQSGTVLNDKKFLTGQSTIDSRLGKCWRVINL